MENYKELLISITKRLVEIDSSLPGTNDWPTQGQKDVLAEFESISKELGFRTKVDPGGSWAWAEIGEGDELLGLLGHLDVVPPGDLSEWKTEPFELTVKEDFMYGRGVIDDKGPVAASMVTLKSILDNNLTLNKRIRIIVGTDEEVLWRGIEEYKKTEEVPSIAFTPDSKFSLIFAEKDLLQLHINGEGTDKFNFEFKGALNTIPGKVEYSGDKLEQIKTNASEKGYKFESTDSQITFLGDQVHAQQAAADGKVNALVNFVNSLPTELQEIPLIKFMVDNVAHGTAPGIFGDVQDEVTGKLTFNSAQLVINNELTQLAVDSRIPVEAYSLAKYEEAITAKAGEYGLKYVKFDYLPPVYSPLDSDLVKSMMAAYEKVTGRKDEPIASGGATYARAIPNCLAFGPKFPEELGTEHQPNEQANIPNMIKAIEVYYEFLKTELSK